MLTTYKYQFSKLFFDHSASIRSRSKTFRELSGTWNVNHRANVAHNGASALPRHNAQSIACAPGEDTSSDLAGTSCSIDGKHPRRSATSENAFAQDNFPMLVTSYSRILRSAAEAIDFRRGRWRNYMSAHAHAMFAMLSASYLLTPVCAESATRSTMG